METETGVHAWPKRVFTGTEMRSESQAQLAARITSMVLLVLEALAAQRTETTQDELLTLDRTGMERAALLKLIELGSLPAARIGRRWYVRKSDLLRLVDVPKAASAEHAQSSPDASYITLVRRTRKAGAA